MRTALCLAILGPLLAGCAAVSHSVGPGADFADLNDRVAGRTALIHLTDGTVYAGDAVRFAPDSTSWVDPDTGGLYAIPTWAIAEVERRDRGRAARRVQTRALVIGTVTGTVAGALMGVAVGYDSGGCLFFCGGSDPSPADRARGAATFGAALGVSGAIGGAVSGLFGGTLVGVASDPDERFVIEAPQPTLRSSPVARPPHAVTEVEGAVVPRAIPGAPTSAPSSGGPDGSGRRLEGAGDG